MLTENRHIALVCNPLAASGRAQEMLQQAVLRLEAENIPCTAFLQNWPETFAAFTDVFVVGGDGTLHFFVNKYPALKLPVTLFNGGTGNDFFGSLYGNISAEAHWQKALFAEPRAVDMGQCNNWYFMNEAGIGFESVVVKALLGKKKKPGKASFMTTVLRKIFSYRERQYAIQLNGKTYSGKKLLIDVCNGKRAGGGFYIAPTAQPNDGLFDVVMAPALSPLQRLRYLPVIEKGKHLGRWYIHHEQTTQLTVESDSRIPLHLDGEYYEAERLVFTLLPAQLYFRY